MAHQALGRCEIAKRSPGYNGLAARGLGVVSCRSKSSAQPCTSLAVGRFVRACPCRRFGHSSIRRCFRCIGAGSNSTQLHMCARSLPTTSPTSLLYSLPCGSGTRSKFEQYGVSCVPLTLPSASPHRRAYVSCAAAGRGAHARARSLPPCTVPPVRQCTGSMREG